MRGRDARRAELDGAVDASRARSRRLPERAGDATPKRTSDASCPANKVLNSVGQLTRQLHDTLAELGYDRQLQDAAAATLPDARQRLAYVVTLTEQAASRSLNAVELATPVQESLAADAQSLAAQLGQRLHAARATSSSSRRSPRRRASTCARCRRTPRRPAATCARS